MIRLEKIVWYILFRMEMEANLKSRMLKLLKKDEEFLDMLEQVS